MGIIDHGHTLVEQGWTNIMDHKQIVIDHKFGQIGEN